MRCSSSSKLEVCGRAISAGKDFKVAVSFNLSINGDCQLLMNAAAASASRSFMILVLIFAPRQHSECLRIMKISKDALGGPH